MDENGKTSAEAQEVEQSNQQGGASKSFNRLLALFLTFGIYFLPVPAHCGDSKVLDLALAFPPLFAVCAVLQALFYPLIVKRVSRVE